MSVCLVLCVFIFASAFVDGSQIDVCTDSENIPGNLGHIGIVVGKGMSSEPAPKEDVYLQLPWTQEEVQMLAKTVWAEARGVPGTAQKAAVVWCVLNRLDAGGFGNTISEVVSASKQFAYAPETPVWGDFLDLSEDVLIRWSAEKAGKEDVGRTLPADYLFFRGDGKVNHFRKEYEKTEETWDWSLPDPYEGG